MNIDAALQLLGQLAERDPDFARRLRVSPGHALSQVPHLTSTERAYLLTRAHELPAIRRSGASGGAWTTTVVRALHDDTSEVVTYANGAIVQSSMVPSRRAVSSVSRIAQGGGRTGARSTDFGLGGVGTCNVNSLLLYDGAGFTGNRICFEATAPDGNGFWQLTDFPRVVYYGSYDPIDPWHTAPTAGNTVGQGGWGTLGPQIFQSGDWVGKVRSVRVGDKTACLKVRFGGSASNPNEVVRFAPGATYSFGQGNPAIDGVLRFVTFVSLSTSPTRDFCDPTTPCPPVCSI